MTKVDITSQEEMATSSDATLADKIYKMIEDQGKVLAKMGLTSLSWKKVAQEAHSGRRE